MSRYHCHCQSVLDYVLTPAQGPWPGEHRDEGGPVPPPPGPHRGPRGPPGLPPGALAPPPPLALTQANVDIADSQGRTPLQVGPS